MPASSNGSGPTPPSGPSSAPEGAGASASGGGPAAPLVPRRGRGWILVLVGGAALASCWNPLGAPFALLAGVIVSVMAVGRLLAGGRRRIAAVALALSAGAAVAAILVLVDAMALGARPQEKLGVEARSPAEAQKALDDAAARSSDERARAAKELEQLPPPGEGAAGAPARRPGQAR